MRFEVYYFTSDAGESPVEKFLDSLSVKARAKCVAHIDLLEERGFALPRSFAAKVRGDIWELRPEWSGTEYRLLYFLFQQNRFVILHGVTKKSQKIRPRDIETAERRAVEVRKRGLK